MLKFTRWMLVILLFTCKSAMALTTAVIINYGRGFNSPNWLHSEPKKSYDIGVHGQLFPDFLNWTYLQLFLQGGVDYLHTNVDVANRPPDVWGIGIGPILRFNLLPHASIIPYIFGGVAFSYLSQDPFGGQDFGSHFNFRDSLGLGVRFGQQQKFSVNFFVLHYSNSNIAKPNEGITIPVNLSMGYQFP